MRTIDIDTVKKLINKYTQGHANIVLNTSIAERYYRNQNDILKQSKKEKDEIDNPLRNADNRIPRNFYGLLVNQKAAYAFTAPPIFDVGSTGNNKVITNILGDSYAKICKDLCINASNAGIGWLHFWINDAGVFEYGVVDSKQIIPIWSSNLNKRLLALLRVYETTDDDGKTWNIYEYWTDTECYAYKKNMSDNNIDSSLIPYNMFTGFISADNDGEENKYSHNFERVPFISFPNNNIMNSDLDNVKPLIDVFDKVFSGFVNDLEDIQEIIFVLTNYQGTDLKTFLSEIKKYKTIKVEAVGAEDKSGLETLTIDIPVEAREKLLEMTRKAIFEQGQGVDPQPHDFGNASGVALKYLYSLLELKTGLMETEFKLGFGEFIRAICKYKNIEVKNIIQTWTRTAITNESELSEICAKSKGVISDKSIIKNHPFVEDADDEVKQIEKENIENEPEIEQFKKSFNASSADNSGGEINEA